ncbi:uncharacterized protein PV06_08994 [Exophiala oligosperma]|uniref:Uncharacterized protein n=1 Tax=Exophiala oligosperma TaxID=215243 RepID=A0A0D2DUB8_9EURO|nr:uncharacterized protein PV06_08994 [Exophiala oligosperma]KIW39199.1 hypothetical protein PV06_08994 [Exophiala oligosperma]
MQKTFPIQSFCPSLKLAAIDIALRSGVGSPFAEMSGPLQRISHFDRGSSFTQVNLDSGFLSSSGDASTNPLNMVKGSVSPRLASTLASDAVDRSSEVLSLVLATC